MKLTTQLEAILYIKAQPLTLEELAETAGMAVEPVTNAMLELMADYAHRDSALE
ncbi:MAG: SMC-Scp complex subunit ScpB, partial [Limnothrix sp.]